MRKILSVLVVFISLSTPSNAASVWEHGQSTFEDAFDSTGLWILGIGSAATIAAFNFDQSMHDNWKEHQRMSAETSKYGDYWGMGYGEIAVVLGQLIWDQENGIVHGEGLAAGAIVTHSTKFATARARPDSNTRTSFPSGHTSVSFGTATALTRSYGYWIGVPLFGAALFTGLSRLADNAHWFSDVVAGATVGILFGRSPFKHHWSVSPLVIDDGGHGGGLVYQYRF